MRNRIILFLSNLLFVSGLFINALNAQPYYFRHYQVEQGLSNNSVYFIRQDSKGFMWFATKDGLNRFDGFHFKVFRIDNEQDKRHLKTDYIYCILPTEDGKLWVGAEGGLYQYDPEKEVLKPFIDSLSNVYDLTFDNMGQLWFISTTTICRYNFKTNSLRKFPPSEYFNATTLCRGSDGNIWVGTDNGFLKKYDQQKNAFESFDMFSHSKAPSSRWIQKIHAGNNNSIFVGTTSQGLKIFNEAEAHYEDLLTYNPDKTSIFIRDILKVSDNEYWFATESGIYILDERKKTFTNLRKKFLDPYSLNDNAIYGLCKDNEGGIWAGTFFGGVNYYAKQNASFKKYFPDNTANSISGNAVREICKDQYGNLWIGTEDGGLNEIVSNTKEIRHFKPGDKSGISYMNIHGLLADSNHLWIGTFEHGIDIMDIKTQKVIKHYNNGQSGLGSNFAFCFLRTSEGKLLVGTSRGLYYFNKKKNKFEMPPEIPGDILVTSIIEDHTGKIWIGTKSNGAYWFDPATHENSHLQNDPGNKNSLSNNSINDVYEDSQGNIWFATDGGGLSKLSKNRTQFTVTTRKNGLPGNFVFKVIEDNNKNIWVTTAKGLVNFGNGSSRPVIYTQANGLLNNQFNYHSGFKDENGRLYFGSVKGMISFMPGDFQKSNFVPPVYITGLQVFNSDITNEKNSNAIEKSITVADEIQLNYDQSSISIDFAALSYVSPEMIEYKYKLEGLDDDWTSINTNRKAYFTNLSPGKYIFKIKASANGQWSRSPTQLVIRISPPVWETSWAYLLYGMVISGLLYYFIRSYHKRQVDKKEKEIYESKIDFFTNVAHEIRTPLTLIKGPVDNLVEKKYQLPDAQEDLACLDRNTNRLMNLVSQILDFRQTEIKRFSLDLQKANVSEILKETYLSFHILAKKRKLDYRLVLPPDEVYARVDSEALYKILSNLIGNAVKYADKKVAVHLYVLNKEKKMLVIEFENDGYIIRKEFAEKIFEPFYRIKETGNKKGTGIGLTLTKSLVDLHNGSLELVFTKKDCNVFVLSIPVQPEIIPNDPSKLSVPNLS